ncbi:hypothetical protein FRC18_008497 [Serendipita sp. 400]|nr:hypothetical protein FRC18_008497 [Serendipita sp. 400]
MGHEKIVRLLLENGADVNKQGGEYGNALYAASIRGREQIVRILLDNGADVNAQGGRHGSAVEAAWAGGHVEVAHLLDHTKGTGAK